MLFVCLSVCLSAGLDAAERAFPKVRSDERIAQFMEHLPKQYLDRQVHSLFTK